MSKLEKYLAKANEQASRKELIVNVAGDEWKVRQLTLQESRSCERLAEVGDTMDWYRYNDARLVKATEHDFPWNDPALLTAYGVGTKFELPAKLFDAEPESYAKLLDAVRRVNSGVSETEVVDELKN
ncbi:hypothetical protein EDM56_04385 [Brevibacillus fluminis]|uniref:Uncharacterized protein n=1 Tax=Brevibacillus fluminis TaxID=511487 RepID=A0A3M8DYE0_9BACL|nr:hypothetical protein [Brevibacillus fluminis]RNB91997.1 hypothetical protein EDM56_04385 [Brevibacillus fluminis]